MAQTFFFSRTTGSNTYYFYLYCTDIQLIIDHEVIAPLLPGNDSTNLAGNGGTNFILDLGKQRLSFRVTGRLTDMASTEFPTLDGTGLHYLTRVEGSSAGSATVSSTQSGRKVHDYLVEWIAEQSESGNSFFRMGYPEWYDDGNVPNDALGEINFIHTAVANQNTRVFEGMIRNFTSDKVAGQPDQFEYSLTFIVGDT